MKVGFESGWFHFPNPWCWWRSLVPPPLAPARHCQSYQYQASACIGHIAWEPLGCECCLFPTLLQQNPRALRTKEETFIVLPVGFFAGPRDRRIFCLNERFWCNFVSKIPVVFAEAWVLAPRSNFRSGFNDQSPVPFAFHGVVWRYNFWHCHSRWHWPETGLIFFPIM